MLHSKKIMQSMPMRKPDEENGGQPAPVAESVEMTPEHVRTVADYLHQHGHHDTASQLEVATGIQSSQPQEQSAPQPLEKYQDPAEPILRSHGVDDATAEKVWDIFHSVRDSKTLIDKLQPLDIPNATKDALVRAKARGDAPPSWLDRMQRVVDAIHRMPKLDSSSTRGGASLLKVAEAHPAVTKILADAALKHEE
jgi:hypothetical protein